jgi:hypothetical protein
MSSTKSMVTVNFGGKVETDILETTIMMYGKVTVQCTGQMAALTKAIG